MYIFTLSLSATLSLFSETGNDYSLTLGVGGKMKLKEYKKEEIKREKKVEPLSSRLSPSEADGW